MPYLLLASVLFSFLLGWWAGYSMNEATVERLEHSIERSNAEAEALLNETRLKAETAQKLAIKTNKELDQAHESSIKTINALHANLADAIAARMRTEHSKSNSDSLPKGRDSRSIKEASTVETGFSEEFARFLAEQARKADELAIYADTANKFINNNCGIAHDSRAGNN